MDSNGFCGSACITHSLTHGLDTLEGTDAQGVAVAGISIMAVTIVEFSMRTRLNSVI